ncbi:MAG: endonuclease/exonuclease/phosphatase family protein [Pirellulales bacterium]
MCNLASRLILLCAVLALDGIAPASAADDAISLRIVTFNAELLSAPRVSPGRIVKYRFDDARNQHLERVAALVETLNADVFNLVEVTSREAVDSLVAKLHEKGLADYRGYHVDSHDSFTAGDVAVISKMRPDQIADQPIRTIYSPVDDPAWRQNFTFPNREGGTSNGTSSLDRNSLYFFTIGGYKLGFLGLHLRSNPQDAYANGKRSAEAEVARRVLRAEIVKRGYLPVVLGDLNDYDPDVPDRDPSRGTSTTVLRDLKDFDPDRPGAELVNVAERIVRVADRYTSHWDRNENRAHDGDDVYTMIDHILLPRELMPYVTRVFISHSVSVDTSDHYPVVVDLRLPVRQ